MRFRWHGTEYAAEFLRRLESGAVLAKAIGHGPRFAPGTEIEVQANEIVSLDEETQAGIFTGKPSDLQAAMDAERETLPPVAEVLADPNPTPPLSASSQAAAPGKSIEELLASGPLVETEPLAPDDPRNRPLPWPSQTGETMTDTTVFSRLQEKAKLAAGAAGEVAVAVEATFDDILAKKAALLERNNAVHAQHSKVIADASAGLDTIESALRLMSNGGPV